MPPPLGAAWPARLSNSSPFNFRAYIVCLTHRAGIQSACGIVPNGPRGRSRSARHATARARVRVWRPRRLSAAPPAARPRCTPRSHTTHTRRPDDGR